LRAAIGRLEPVPDGPVAPPARKHQPRDVPRPAGSHVGATAMKRLLFLAWLPALAACGGAQSSEPGIPDISGVWMPTAIGPDGERAQVMDPDVPYLPEVREAMAAIRANYNPVVDDANRSCLPYGMP